MPTHGGARPGAGRKPTGIIRKMRGVKMTDTEWQLIKELAKKHNMTTSEYIRKKALEQL